MDKQPTQEQIKEFWKWCGLIEDCPPEKDAYHRGIWKDSLGMRFDTPAIDLNNLFKYAVPKFQQKGQPITLDAQPESFLCRILKESFSQTSDGFGLFLEPIGEAECKNPTLALFWAIWEVIHGQEN